MNSSRRRLHPFVASTFVAALSGSVAAAPPNSAPPSAPTTPTSAPAPAPAPAPPTSSSTPAQPSAPPAPPAPAPAPESPAAPAPAPAPESPAAPALAPPPHPPSVSSPEEAPPAPNRLDSALVHLAVDYPGAVLELRNYVDAGEWAVACAAPCDKTLVTLGAEARVSAPGMTRSNVFRIDPGPGIALVKVSGGSDKLRSFGILGLAVGIPVGLAGTAMYSYGKYDDRDGLALAGSIVLGTGAVMILAAIPMLIASTTNVRDAKGSFIASAPGAGETN